MPISTTVLDPYGPAQPTEKEIVVGFPENVLARDERVERSIHPHWLTVALPTFVGVLLVVAAVGVTLVTPDDSTGNRIQLIVVGVLLVLALWLVVVPFMKWRTTHYVVTSHRVMVRRGILSKSGKDITLSKITDVSFAQTLLDRIINAGSLHVESAGDSPDEDFSNIPNSNEVQQLINRLIDEDDLRRRSYISHGAAGDPDDDEGDRGDRGDRGDHDHQGGHRDESDRSHEGDSFATRDPRGRRPRRPDRPELAEERRRPSRDEPE